MTIYLYRDRLTRRELLPAIGAGAAAGIGVALAVTYLTQTMLRKRAIDSEPPGERLAKVEA